MNATNEENDNGSELGRRFVLGWMLNFLGFPLGGALALVVVGSIDGVLSGVLAGAVIGTAQWLVLRGYAGVGTSWIVATALGVAIGDATGAALTGAGTRLGDLLVVGAATGVAVGLSQWGLLRRRGRAALWPPVVAVAWSVGWTVTWAVGVDVERGYAVFGSTGALVYAVITAAAMWLVLRVPARPGVGA